MCTVIPKQKLQSMHDYRPELNLVVFYGSNPLQALLRSSTLHRLTESEWAFPFEEYPEKAFTSHLQLLPSRFAKRALSCWLIFRAGKFTSKGSDNPFTDFDLEREALLRLIWITAVFWHADVNGLAMPFCKFSMHPVECHWWKPSAHPVPLLYQKTIGK